MWTYRPEGAVPAPAARPAASSAPAQAPSVSRPAPGAAQQTPQKPADTGTSRVPAKSRDQASMPRPAARRAGRRTAPGTAALAMGALYLVGLGAGSLCSGVLREPLVTYADYAASIQLELHRAGGPAMVFSAGFLSLFCQCTLLAVFGFCVLGVGLIPLVMLLKGAGTGVYLALLYSRLGAAKGLLFQALVLWLPEVLGSLLVILLSVSALQLSRGLAGCCVGGSAQTVRPCCRRLVNRYLAVCLACMLPCGLSAILSLLFGGLF